MSQNITEKNAEDQIANKITALDREIDEIMASLEGDSSSGKENPSVADALADVDLDDLF